MHNVLSGTNDRFVRSRSVYHRARGFLGLLVAVGALVIAGAHALRADTPDACAEIPGSVTFGGLTVTPASPEVGDDVELQFDTAIAVYSVSAVELSGADLLAGTTTLHGTGSTSFQLTAVRAGTMSLQLAITYATEVQCVDSNGIPYINGYGDDHTVTSPVYDVTIAEAHCIGDCNRDGEVTINEVLTLVNIALGNNAVSIFSCPAADPDGDHAVVVTDIVKAVHGALSGCGSPEAGYCYESSSCFPSDTYPTQPFGTNRGRCCELQRNGGGVPFSWCPADQFDSSSGACAQCANPC